MSQAEVNGRSGVGSVVSIFESGVRDRIAIGGRFASSMDAGADRPRAYERIGRAHVARPAAAAHGPIAALFLALSRLIFPVLLLATLAAAAVIYGAEPADWLGGIGMGGKPLDTGMLALPVSLFIVQLTNRRYGAAYALAQIGATGALIAVAAVYIGDDVQLLRGSQLPEPRIFAAFGMGLLVAQLVSVVVFDRLRGPRWWQAPFFATLLGSVALCLVAYPLAYTGAELSWMVPMFAYMAVLAAMSLALLIPYWLLRAVIAPLPGFGGY